jgi:GNAT superfamily N-acetyltransferase
VGNVADPNPRAQLEITAPRPLAASDDLSRFTCGKEALNDWLCRRAAKAEGRSARTYVVTSLGRVVGYYCLATGGVSRASAPSKLRREMPDPVPMIVVGRLAVDLDFQGRGIGGGLLKDAISRSLHLASAVGVRGLLVHALDDDAKAFYVEKGFLEFPFGSRTLFLPIETMVASLGS